MEGVHKATDQCTLKTQRIKFSMVPVKRGTCAVTVGLTTKPLAGCWGLYYDDCTDFIPQTSLTEHKSFPIISSDFWAIMAQVFVSVPAASQCLTLPLTFLQLNCKYQSS